MHGLAQAIQKRGLPRALLTDNGAAMLAAEVQQGLARLGIVPETTLPYSPYQNAKLEVFRGQVEKRLLAMLEAERELTLERLNEATQAWVELEYHRHRHAELDGAPLERYLAGPDVGRRSRNTLPARPDRPGRLTHALACRDSSTPAEAGNSDTLTGVAPAGAPALASPTTSADSSHGPSAGPQPTCG